MKNSDIKISVLMPSLNVAPYIGESISSVAGNSMKEIEILCIDAGSTDGTREIIERMSDGDGRIRLIPSEVKSYGYQMNLGLSKAKGEYITIVETDDFIDSDAFEQMYHTAKKTGAQIVKTDYYYFNTKTGDNQKANNVNRFPTEKILNPERCRKLFCLTKTIWSAIYQREFLENNRISFTETPGASYQDIGFFVKTMLCADRVYLMPQGYLHYRTDNENSSVHSKEKQYAVCDEYESIESFMAEKPGMQKKYKNTIRYIKARDYLWNYERLEENSKKEFIQNKGSEFSFLIDSPVWRLRNCIDDHGMAHTLKRLLMKNGK